VEQQSTPWRVFDAPASAEDPAPTSPVGGGTPGTPGTRGIAVASSHLALVGLLTALGVGALALVFALGQSGDGSVFGPSVSNAAFGSGAPDPTGGQVVVDVAGAVVRPGVYHLAIGSRVADAIAAAGGFGPRVDADAVGVGLNLAAPLKDGQQVRVPSRDDSGPSPGSGGTSRSGGSGGGSKLVDLNSATAAELDALPGIGPVTAGKIVAARTQAPFKTVDELRSRGLVGQKTFDQIKALLTVS
jgi:competence protein ComEA